jgi:RNA polymerase sigma-70 factor (ECF subfamily)
LSDIPQIAESIFRREFGRVIARLIRASGSIDMAEDALQEAFASALAAWPEKGIPEDPAAWIIAVASRKLISAMRREQTKRTKRDEVSYELRIAQRTDEVWEGAFTEQADDRLRLFFTCCHPALNREGQIALTLRTLGGLTTSEIAKAFVVSESTVAQRLVRVKRKIREARIPYTVPTTDQLPGRLAAVQAVVYLIFNEGYLATSGDRLIRKDLCREAVRLGRLLCELLPGEPENRGLLALMLLNDSRAAARVNQLGELSPLEEQDRSLWNHDEIEEGLDIIENALSARRAGPYQLQAAIAALHAQADTPADTDWVRIAALYGKLLEVARSPIMVLNHAAAVAMAGGLAEALQRIDTLEASGRLDNYYLLHAARADILRRLGQRDMAAESYSRALSLTRNRVEQGYIRRRLAELVHERDFCNLPDAASPH